MARPKESVPQAMADEVVAWISEGKTLREFCRQEGKPSRQTIDNWKDKDSAFASRIARAREDGYDEIADYCLEIIDSATDANLGKARVWTRLQLLAKWNPRKYGDKVDHTLAAPDGGPVQHTIAITFVNSNPKE